MTKSGQSFVGWNTSADGSGTSYTAGSTFEIGSANVDLYAVWVTGIDFVKLDYGSEQDCITGNVCITRGSSSGIYNSVQESWHDRGFSPSDTEWYFGSYCQGDYLFFSNWADSTTYNPPVMVGNPGCLHLITDDQYYNILFSSWTSGGNGGGFAYRRTSAAWTPVYPEGFFRKRDYGSEQDCITPSVCITRGSSQGLYNAAQESWYSHYSSPSDTEWYFGGGCQAGGSFSNWESATGNNPPNMVGNPGCLHLISDNLYFDIIFYQWTSGSNGGGFTYVRTPSSWSPI